MVAVADGEVEQREILGQMVFFIECLAVVQRVHGVNQRVSHLALRDEPAVDVSAALHQIGVIDLVEPVELIEHRLDDRAVGIVDQDHDVRQFHGGVLADLEARRNALLNGLFGRTDQRAGACLVLIGLEVDGGDQTAARCGSAGETLGQDETGRQLTQGAVGQITLHGGIDVCDALCDIILLQIDLRQRDAECGRRVADGAVGLRPVFRLGGVLVAGDDGPLAKISTFLRDENLWDGYTRHNWFSSK